MRRFLILCCLAALGGVVLPTASFAAAEPSGPSISLPISTVASGDAGSVHGLASVPVDAALQGSAFTVRSVTDHSDSVDPDSTPTCQPPPTTTQPPPTTTQPPPTTTQPPPTTTQPPPTTTQPPPTTTVPPNGPTTEVTVVVRSVTPAVQPPATPVPAQPTTAG